MHTQESSIAEILAGMLSSQLQPFEDAAAQTAFAASPEVRIASRISRIPQVESIYMDRSGDMIHVWTVIDQDDDAVHESIYKDEKLLIHELDRERFDFHVIARRGRPLRSLITLNYLWYARD